MRSTPRRGVLRWLFRYRKGREVVGFFFLIDGGEVCITMATVRGGLHDWKGNAGPLIIKLGHKERFGGKRMDARYMFLHHQVSTSHQSSPMVQV